MKRKYLIFIFILIFFIFLGLYLFDSIKGIDDIMYNFISVIKSDYMTKIMKFITFFGSTKFILFLMILFLIFSFRNKKIFNIINIIIIGDVLLNNLIKILVRRDRPILINLVHETSFSFPSGHTMVSITLYGFIIYLISKSNITKIMKVILIVLLSLLILFIVVSRIYLGAHYFSDCMAGIALASAYLLMCIEILERKKLL